MGASTYIQAGQIQIKKIYKEKTLFFFSRFSVFIYFLILRFYSNNSFFEHSIVEFLVAFTYWPLCFGKWYLLGKEIDHRLKIYFKVNSSTDRPLYRIFLGHSVLCLFYFVLSLFSFKIMEISYWVFWFFLFVVFSWPTRGKIIEQSLNDQIKEIKYLDTLEKLVLFFIVFFFIISIPEVSFFNSYSTLKLYFDHKIKFSWVFWDILDISLLPFFKSKKLTFMASYSFFYVFGLGLTLFTGYALNRFFLSRRSSLIATFSIVSTWSYVLLAEQDFSNSLVTTYSIIWIWSMLWCCKSSTYRSGLFYGLNGFWGSLLVDDFFILSVLGLFLIMVFTKNNQTDWYRKQFIKYALLGLIASFCLYLLSGPQLNFKEEGFINIFNHYYQILSRKGIFFMVLVGPVMIFYNFYSKRKIRKYFEIKKRNFGQLGFSLIIILALNFFLNSDHFMGYTFIWCVAFFSFFPLEWLLQNSLKSKKRKNFLYMYYFLLCLIDSHIEGRIKNFINFFS